MKVIGCIPSRYASTRLPGKPLCDIGGKPMVIRVVEKAMQVKNLHDVVVLTDDERILKVVNDQFGSPTWTYRVASQLELLLEQGREGLYHVTAEGHCSWYDLAVYFLEKIGVPSRVEPCSAIEYAAAAPRPANSILGNGRLIKEKLNRMRHWQNDVDQFVLLYRDCLIEMAEKS